MEGASAFYTGSEEVISRLVTVKGVHTELSQINNIYETIRCTDWIKHAGFKRVSSSAV